MQRRLTAVTLASLLTGVLWGADREPNPWAGYEPMTGPVEVRPIKTWVERETDLESFRFASHQWEGEWQWVYAIYGKPKGEGPFPAMLHIHGGGQTASVANILDWTRQGYAVLTFDWTGTRSRRPQPADEVTHWPKGVGSPRTTEPTIQYSAVFHAVLAARRGLTHLLSRPEVDASRVGSYGISWGGYIMWLVNGIDDRLRAACAIYGCGIVAARGESAKNIQEEWSDAYEPIHYASRQHAPILYLGSTNDFFGWVPTFAAVRERVSVESRSAWAVNENHHIAPVATTAYRWMDRHVKGGPAMEPEPTVQLLVQDGRLVASITAPQATAVAVIYSRGEAQSPLRAWFGCAARADGDVWLAEMEVANPDESVWAIANATYLPGHRLSSRPVFAVPAKLGTVSAAPRSDRVVYDPNTDGATCTMETGVELYSCTHRPRLANDGPDGGKCLVIEPVSRSNPRFRLRFRHVRDLERQGRDDEALALWIAGKTGHRIAIGASTARRGPNACFGFGAKIDDKDTGWRRVVVTRQQLKNKAQESLPSWAPIHWLSVAGQHDSATPARIGRIEWIAE